VERPLRRTFGQETRVNPHDTGVRVQLGRSGVKVAGSSVDPNPMDRRTRRDVGVASVIGASLVVATLGVGHVFAPDGAPAVEGASGDGRGGALVVAGVDRSDGRRRDAADRARADAGTPVGGGGTPTSGPTPGIGAVAGGTGSGGTGSGSGTDGGTDTGIGSSASGAAGSDGGTGGAGTGGGAADGGATGGGPPSGGDGTVTTAGVRLRVTDLSVTGTDSGTLKAGSEVRVRLAATRTTTSTGATTSSTATIADRRGPAAGLGAAGGGVVDVGTGSTDDATTGRGSVDGSGTVAGDADDAAGGAADAAAGAGSASDADDPGSGASGAASADEGLPERLDVRIRLDDDAVAALGRTTTSAAGPVALKALVDLVEGDATASGAYRVRVRMQLTPAQAARAAVADAGRSTDGVSNVVAVTTPIGTTDPSGAPGVPLADDGTSTTSPSPAPVEVLVPVPMSTGGSSTTDGASVGVPIPSDATPSGDAPTTADAAVVVHVPDADEPIGGTPEDLTATPPATQDPVVPAPGPGADGTGGPADTAPDAPTTTAAEPPTATTTPDPSSTAADPSSTASDAPTTTTDTPTSTTDTAP
jgi:hypothetical protein